MEGIAKYIFEAGMLKRVKRSGWWAEKVDKPESVADHSFRTAVVAFILAKMEGLGDEEANRLCTAAVFHDMHEARLGDMNKITARYIEVKRELTRKVEKEQTAAMPVALQNPILGTLDLSDKERMILKDADYLECAFQAKEYLDIGYKGAQTWMDNIGKRLKTKSAKRLHAKLKTLDSNCWWKGLKKLD
ncbi:MAG: HD domain-containing protein [Candidatus Micrarchaeota archaeon]